MKSKTRKAAGKASLNPLVRLFRSCKTIRNAMFQDCMGKSHCSPMETDLNPDYHVEVTFTIAEIREFCFAARNAEKTTTPLGRCALHGGRCRPQCHYLPAECEHHKPNDSVRVGAPAPYPARGVGHFEPCTCCGRDRNVKTLLGGVCPSCRRGPSRCSGCMYRAEPHDAPVCVDCNEWSNYEPNAPLERSARSDDTLRGDVRP